MDAINFTFPENCFLVYDTIKNPNNKGWFENIDILKPSNNVISIGGTDYCFTYLKGAEPGNKGGNSIVLKLFELQNIDEDDIQYNEPDMVLKISKWKSNPKPDKNEKRFTNEIDCLIKTRDSSENIIEILHYGRCKIQNKNGKVEEHAYYTMEYAPYDLKDYIETNHNILTIENKVLFCLSLCNGLSELRDLGIYHRDIKPDNIFITHDNTWKIGDLGLASEQNKNFDDIAEFIGPKGWLSPEAMNKRFCEGKGFLFKHNYNIDHQSDIFQLGKIFWYIFQYNSPEGCIRESDFQIRNSQIYQTIRTMLNYSKSRRYKDIKDVITNFKRVENNLMKTNAA